MYLRALFLLALLPLWIRAADPVSSASSSPTGEVTALVSAKYTNALTLQPKEEFGQVAKTFAWALQRTHYTRNRFDDTISGKFFDRYLEVLDPQRVYFLQSDYDGFAPLRTELDNLTVQYGNVQPAFDIFNRFMERFDQQYAFVTEYLKTNRFTFETDEKFVLDRKDGARPKDLEEARNLFDGLRNLRTELMGQLLASCSSVKTVRLFLSWAQETGVVDVDHLRGAFQIELGSKSRWITRLKDGTLLVLKHG